MGPRRLVLATANDDKVAEIRRLLPGIELLPRPAGLPEAVEDGATLFDNALIKARSLVEATGQPAVADDTGLEVDALGGGPGVHTARFAGPEAGYADNVSHLLEVLRGSDDRRARFRTVALVLTPEGSTVWAEGSVEGRIAEEPRGEGGFGYDPVFIPLDGDGRTFAEMADEEKNAISHRGRAFTALAARLEEL
ncbi:MAG TPA: RdgB/HAM1 family non-canonical purine NTP pyrophosphatase [Acidimicrobiales bacterium]|nr:RdgB/HAM1 family non-canonical purine NTP pyrophosphatase [Acidimicrobiales bacterium]